MREWIAHIFYYDSGYVGQYEEVPPLEVNGDFSVAISNIYSPASTIIEVFGLLVGGDKLKLDPAPPRQSNATATRRASKQRQTTLGDSLGTFDLPAVEVLSHINLLLPR